jgi:hypothetical protein
MLAQSASRDESTGRYAGFLLNNDLMETAMNYQTPGAAASVLIAALICAGASLAAHAAEPARATNSAPNFAPDPTTGWLAQDDEFIPPPGGPGPVVSDPAHPYVSFYKSPRNPHPAFRIADLTNPILQPWTRERLRRVNTRVVSGEVVAIPKERCWPVGLPGFLLLPATPVYFLQTAKDVRMIWMQDRQIRRIRLDAQHPAEVKPSWYGDSVGRYEGDTLVVDTVGITTKAYVDNYQTPHTDALHVVERYHLIDGGDTLEVNIHVEDPGAFTTPWNAIQRYRKVNRGPLSEIVCPENNDDHFHHRLEPMPEADKPDF